MQTISKGQNQEVFSEWNDSGGSRPTNDEKLFGGLEIIYVISDGAERAGRETSDGGDEVGYELRTREI